MRIHTRRNARGIWMNGVYSNWHGRGWHGRDRKHKPETQQIIPLPFKLHPRIASDMATILSHRCHLLFLRSLLASTVAVGLWGVGVVLFSSPSLSCSCSSSLFLTMSSESVTSVFLWWANLFRPRQSLTLTSSRSSLIQESMYFVLIQLVLALYSWSWSSSMAYLTSSRLGRLPFNLAATWNLSHFLKSPCDRGKILNTECFGWSGELSNAWNSCLSISPQKKAVADVEFFKFGQSAEAVCKAYLMR